MRTMRALILSSVILSLFWTGGCGFSSKPRPPVESYTLEYATPDMGKLPELAAVVRISGFLVDPAYNTVQMVYSDAAFARNTDPYRRWRANPADMATFFLARDMAASGLFQAALPLASHLNATHVLDGTVEEFYEKDTPHGWFAVLALTITLERANTPDVSRRVVFQKKYARQQPVENKNAQGLAQAMSLAMSEVSKNIIQDIYQALTHEQEKTKGGAGKP